MQVLKTITEVRSWLSGLPHSRGSLGLVPTMGALHEGHLSLIQNCTCDNSYSAVSIFVNPTQFNDDTDFDNYPRDLEGDLRMISELNVDLVFAPSAGEMYPENDQRRFDLGNLDKVMEGIHRPGHFNGVAQVVTKLFEIIVPDKAYFGEKDFQQLAIIRHIVRTLDLKIDIIGNPIIRESDGLALSSRNRLLSPAEREAAALIPKTLFEVTEPGQKPTVGDLKIKVSQTIDKHPLLKLEYFEIVDNKTLEPATAWKAGKDLRACIAVWCGRVRLIDNMNISY